jgi:hypothetical protein
MQHIAGENPGNLFTTCSSDSSQRRASTQPLVSSNLNSVLASPTRQYQLLSKPNLPDARQCGLNKGNLSVIDGSLEQQLLGGDSNQLENRRLNRIYDRSYSKITRTTMFSSIEDEIVTAFAEELIAANPELLEKAYVETADRMKFDDRVKMAVLRREQVVRSRPMRPIGRGGIEQVTAKVTAVRSQPIALLTLGLVSASLPPEDRMSLRRAIISEEEGIVHSLMGLAVISV